MGNLKLVPQFAREALQCVQVDSLIAEVGGVFVDGARLQHFSSWHVVPQVLALHPVVQVAGSVRSQNHQVREDADTQGQAGTQPFDARIQEAESEDAAEDAESAKDATGDSEGAKDAARDAVSAKDMTGAVESAKDLALGSCPFQML